MRDSGGGACWLAVVVGACQWWQWLLVDVVMVRDSGDGGCWLMWWWYVAVAAVGVDCCGSGALQWWRWLLVTVVRVSGGCACW